MTDFVSLHNQTDFSILDSLCSVKELFEKAKELGQPALAITEHGSFASAWDALKLSKSTGVKLIIGVEIYFRDDVKNDDRMRHLVLLAKNATGYRNILTLNKLGFDTDSCIGKRVYPVIDWEMLEKYSEGIICLTACGNGIISQLLMNRRFDDAEAALLRLQNIFGDNLGIEVQPNNMQRGANVYNDEIDQKFINYRLIKLGEKLGIKVVAACNTHYTNKEDYETHDVFLSIGSRQPVYSTYRLRYPVPDFYLKSGDEVKSFFSRNYGDELAEELCANSLYFASMCEDPVWIDPKHSNPSGKELPVFPVKDEADYDEFLRWNSAQKESVRELDEDKRYLRYACDTLFDKRTAKVAEEKIPEYKLQIVEELDVLEYHGFSSYMLIVADYINWAKQNGIPVGAGRGSVGGSLIAYLLGIHEADPIKYGLIFARFHNKEKSSFPDIDTDFAPSGRSAVQDYLRRKYGDDHVAHVSNVNTITPKVYARDIARSCELGGSREDAVQIGNDVADCIPADIRSIDDALAKVPLFAEYCKKYPEFLKYKAICGKYRAWSTHAGGIIISQRPLTGLIPLRRDKDGALAIEYDKDKAEDNGLVKMDTLGLSTLDTIGKTLNLIKNAGKPEPVEMYEYDVYDKKTYDLISSGDTFKVFQLGTSAGTIDLCKNVKPQNIADIANINALARPSARDMRQDFIATKNGKRKMTLLHPTLERGFGQTYGFGLYEECLMYLAQDVAKWSLHEADRLRKLTKAKGKSPEKAKQWRKEFIQGGKDNGINEQIVKRIWDEVVDKFQGYGFNKSHATLYSMIGYQTAYLKAHYPIEFLQANLIDEVNSNAQDAKSNIEKIKKELRQRGVQIVPPDINKSELTYVLEDRNRLITGLDALKFVGEEAIKDIVAKRPFKSFFDFMVRVDSRKVRANNIQALAACGAFDSFGISRKLLYLYCSDYRKKLQVWKKKHDPNVEEFSYPWPNDGEWSESEIYALEHFYLGEGFICKPYKAYGKFFEGQYSPFSDIKKAKDKDKFQYLKAIVVDFFEFKVKKETSKSYGMPMAKAMLEDKNGDQCMCTIFPDRWQFIQDRLKMVKKNLKFDSGVALYFSGTVNYYNDEVGIILENLYNATPPPDLPIDRKARKARKVTLKRSKKEKTNEKKTGSLLEQMEDFLYDQGLIDLDSEDVDD